MLRVSCHSCIDAPTPTLTVLSMRVLSQLASICGLLRSGSGGRGTASLAASPPAWATTLSLSKAGCWCCSGAGRGAPSDSAFFTGAVAGVCCCWLSTPAWRGPLLRMACTRSDLRPPTRDGRLPWCLLGDVLAEATEEKGEMTKEAMQSDPGALRGPRSPTQESRAAGSTRVRRCSKCNKC